MQTREATVDELRLIRWLVRRANMNFDDWDWEGGLVVSEMSDGGMGSLRLLPRTAASLRAFGKQAADCKFVDADGIHVIASLNVDREGRLFELDIWKMGYKPLCRIPNEDELEPI